MRRPMQAPAPTTFFLARHAFALNTMRRSQAISRTPPAVKRQLQPHAAPPAASLGWEVAAAAPAYLLGLASSGGTRREDYSAYRALEQEMVHCRSGKSKKMFWFALIRTSIFISIQPNSSRESTTAKLPRQNAHRYASIAVEKSTADGLFPL